MEEEVDNEVRLNDNDGGQRLLVMGFVGKKFVISDCA
jgi:hypothetical protein